MPVTLIVFLSVLLLAGIVLMWEARTGRFTSGSQGWDVARGVLFFLATVAGGALLIRSAGGTALLALAFVPVTLLSLLRFVALARRRWAGLVPVVMMALALFSGLSLGLRALPEPISEGMLLEHILHLGGESSPDSIDPDARRSIRL